MLQDFVRFPIQTEKTLKNNRTDILIDAACSFDTRIKREEEDKFKNYSEMNYEIARIWKMRKVEVIPAVIGELGTATKQYEKWLEKLQLDLAIEALQKTCLLATGRIIRNVLDIK